MVAKDLVVAAMLKFSETGFYRGFLSGFLDVSDGK